MQQLFEVENKNTDRYWERKKYGLQNFSLPTSVLRYISSKITFQTYFVTSKSSFEIMYFVTSRK